MVVKLRTPYLIFLGDVAEAKYGKTGMGLVHWCPELVSGQLRLPGCGVDLGVRDLTIEEAAAAGVKSLIIGVAIIGGRIPEPWCTVLEQAIESGMDIVSGMHTKLNDMPDLVAKAELRQTKLIDVRTPPKDIPIGTGKRRSGRRVLMVGTDCAVGKKYSALSLAAALKKRGIKATFRATGQTGIMLAGSGIAVDAVIADFIAGAAEIISPANDHDHWDVIEGQGSLFNPAYAGVTLGLTHGSQPDALVMCHDVNRKFIGGDPEFPTPPLHICMEMNLQAAKLTNKNARFVGISINTSSLSPDQRRKYLDRLAHEMQLPCIDPIMEGADAIADYIIKHF